MMIGPKFVFRDTHRIRAVDEDDLVAVLEDVIVEFRRDLAVDEHLDRTGRIGHMAEQLRAAQHRAGVIAGQARVGAPSFKEIAQRLDARPIPK